MNSGKDGCVHWIVNEIIWYRLGNVHSFRPRSESERVPTSRDKRIGIERESCLVALFMPSTRSAHLCECRLGRALE